MLFTAFICTVNDTLANLVIAFPFWKQEHFPGDGDTGRAFIKQLRVCTCDGEVRGTPWKRADG